MSDTTSNYTPAELDRMTDEELVALGTELDEVYIKHRTPRWPEGKVTKAENRAARGITAWFVIAGLLAVSFIGIYIFWPWQYKGLDGSGYWYYTLYTPLLGITLGGSVLALGLGAVLITKNFVPEEVSVQNRHDGPSEDVDRRTIVAELNDAWKTSSLSRRKAVLWAGGFAASVIGLAAIMPLGGLVKNPWKRGELGVTGDGTLWTTGWTLASADRPDGKPAEKVYLGRDTGRIALNSAGDVDEDVQRLVRMRPEDISPGSMETVYPLVEHALGSDYAEQMHILHGARNPVMLIRLRPADAVRVQERQGQENFNYGDFYAYSKICTHLACPTSLYEQQTNRILCPCHQSQFDALNYAKPIFGPAARALPQLPIAVDDEGYFVAAGDFTEPVGPAFWERRS